jgi:23S rRNA (pseudouridine1915-N3)-methyltransferase
MYKIKILTIGKTKENWLEEALSEYYKRLKPTAQIEFVYVKDNDQLLSMVEKNDSIVALDACGDQMDSLSFSTFLLQKLEQGGSRLTFVIGGAEGLPAAIKKSYPLVSLSPLTFTHQIARLILVEQIYRAFEIEKGSRYHK